MSKDGVKPSNWIESVNCAIEGILWAAKTQRHMRYHFLAALGVLLLALLFKVSALELILLSLASIRIKMNGFLRARTQHTKAQQPLPPTILTCTICPWILILM